MSQYKLNYKRLYEYDQLNRYAGIGSQYTFFWLPDLVELLSFINTKIPNFTETVLNHIKIPKNEVFGFVKRVRNPESFKKTLSLQSCIEDCHPSDQMIHLFCMHKLCLSTFERIEKNEYLKNIFKFSDNMNVQPPRPSLPSYRQHSDYEEPQYNEHSHLFR